MPTVTPVVAYVDHLGYLRCRACVDPASPPAYDARGPAPKYADDSSLEGEACETCHAPMLLGPGPRRWYFPNGKP